AGRPGIRRGYGRCRGAAGRAAWGTGGTLRGCRIGSRSPRREQQRGPRKAEGKVCRRPGSGSDVFLEGDGFLLGLLDLALDHVADGDDADKFVVLDDGDVAD